LGALKELRVSGESEKEEELTQTELEFPSSPTNPTVETGATGIRLRRTSRGAVNGIEDTRDQGESHRGGDVGIQRVEDDQRRGDGDWKTR
jgi:hypothetical protein